MLKLRQPFRIWIHGLCAAFLGGAATGSTLMVLAPDKVNLSDLATLGKVCGVSGVLAAIAYIKRSPLPPLEEDCNASQKSSS